MGRMSLRDIRPFFGEKFMKKRISEPEEILPKEKIRGTATKLKNKRVALGTDGERYFLKFKSLTTDKKISRMNISLSKEAMFALVLMYEELGGPLPDGVEFRRNL